MDTQIGFGLQVGAGVSGHGGCGHERQFSHHFLIVDSGVTNFNSGF